MRLPTETALMMIWPKLTCSADKSLLKNKIMLTLTILWESCMKVGMVFLRNPKQLFCTIAKPPDTNVQKPT